MDMRSKIAITMGDPAGIGPEIIVKALADSKIYEHCIPVVIGDELAMQDAIQICNSNLEIRIIQDITEAKGEYGKIDCISLGYLNKNSWEYKKPQKLCGEASFNYVVYAIKLALSKQIEATITAPINKESINMAGHYYSGHTEIFAEYSGVKDYAMLLASGDLRVIHVSTHVSLREACDRVKKDRVLKVIRLADQAMKMLGYKNPVIAVAGLNPHCSENSLFGYEEEREIMPAIEEARREGFNVIGPEPPDTVFVKCASKKCDIVVAMYHDQGHIPLKLAGFKADASTNEYVSMSGINCTIGLPIIRVSVDHGTAYGKAGDGKANPQSMLEAIYTGIQIIKNR